MISQKDLEALYKAGQQFLHSLTPEQTYMALVEEGKKLCHAQWGSVFLPTPNGFKKVYSSIPSLLLVKPRKRGTVYKAFTFNKPHIYTQNEVRIMKKNHSEFSRLPIQSVVLIPLSYGDDSMGVVAFQSNKKNHFTKETVDILQLFCSTAFLCIQKTLLLEEKIKALNHRDLFISIAAHELKTPLTSALLYTQALEKKLQKNLTSERKLSSAIFDELTRLSRLINEFLQVEQIKKGKMNYQFESCSLSKIIQCAVVDFKQIYPFHTVEIVNHLGEDVDKVKGDFDKLIQVVTNLLQNAAKYSAPNERITVLLERNDGRICLSIIDRGKGIPKKDIPNIFDKFYKGKNSIHEGMGLGLYLIKNIIEQHQGRLYVTSEVKKGTTIKIQFN